MSCFDEIECVRAAQKGDEEAFSIIVEHHHKAVRACLAARLNDPHEAEDLAQEVFITAFRKLPEFDPERPLAPWLRGIAFNLLRNHWRKFRAESVGGNEELEALLDQQVSAQCSAEKEPYLLAALQDCLGQLDGPSRQLLQRRYGDEQSVKQLSDSLQRGYSALTMQLHRLRELLAHCIEEKINKIHHTT